MSSTYSVLCLSHDPAVVAADGDWNRAEMAEAAIAAGIEGHEQCDLLIGRYSYPLVELGCPSSGPRREGQAGGCYHRGTRWADIDWIRLLFVAQQQDAGTLVRMTADMAGRLCWTPERLRRLRMEIGTDFVMRPEVGRPIRDCGKGHVHDAHDWDDFDGGEYGCIGIPVRKASPAPCSIDHDCPGQVWQPPTDADPMATQDHIEDALRRSRDRWMPDGDPVYIAALVSDALTEIRRD